MRAFSQLLDDLVYTRSRNTKLKLIGDYLKDTPDPDRGIALAALTGTLDIPAVKGAAIRAIAEERVDPVLLYMSRDYVGDMAETVVAAVADAGRRAARARRRRRSASPTRSSGCAAPAGSDAPRDARARCSTISTLSGRFALLKLATGALRVGISARLAKQALADAFGARCRCGRGGVARASAALSRAVRLGRRPRARSRRRATCRCSARSCSPTRSTTARSRSTILPPNGNGTGSASSWSTPAARPGSTAAPATTFRAAFPTSPRPFRSAACSTASCWCAARTRAPTSMAAPRRASTRSSSGSAARIVSAKMQGDYPAFVRLYDILFDGEEDLRALPWTERRARLEAFVDAARSGPLRPVAIDRGARLRGARGDPRRRARRGDRRA